MTVFLTFLAVAAFILTVYGLGVLGAYAIREFRKPYRHKRFYQSRGKLLSGRRSGVDRRQQQIPYEGEERRSGVERRKGIERRSYRPFWSTASVVGTSVFVLSGIAALGYAASPVPSFFSEYQTQFINSGWADCDTPITWSTDTSRLSTKDKKIAVTQLQSDISKWSAASGLTFQYSGEILVNYNDTTYQLETTQPVPSDRHIMIAFLYNNESSLLDERTIGFANPSKVSSQDKTITRGSMALSVEYVKKASMKKESALYLHELGHVLGLGHGNEKENAMYYLVDQTNTLSPGDIEGIRQLVKVCEP